MSELPEKPTLTLTEYQRKYQRQRKRGEKLFAIKPSDNNELHAYYDEYLQTMQQSYLPTVDFHNFIVQFAKMGWLNARDKFKGK